MDAPPPFRKRAGFGSWNAVRITADAVVREPVASLRSPNALTVLRACALTYVCTYSLVHASSPLLFLVSDPLGLPGLGSSVETVWPLGTDSDEVLDLLKEVSSSSDPMLISVVVLLLSAIRLLVLLH